MNEQEIKQLQLELKQKGLYLGEIDGIIGPKTEKAIQANKAFTQRNQIRENDKYLLGSRANNIKKPKFSIDDKNIAQRFGHYLEAKFTDPTYKDPLVEDLIEVPDYWGISNYDDASRAYSDGVFDHNDILETASSIPIIKYEAEIAKPGYSIYKGNLIPIADQGLTKLEKGINAGMEVVQNTSYLDDALDSTEALDSKYFGKKWQRAFMATKQLPDGSTRPYTYQDIEDKKNGMKWYDGSKLPKKAFGGSVGSDIPCGGPGQPPCPDESWSIGRGVFDVKPDDIIAMPQIDGYIKPQFNPNYTQQQYQNDIKNNVVDNNYLHETSDNVYNQLAGHNCINGVTETLGQATNLFQDGSIRGNLTFNKDALERGIVTKSYEDLKNPDGSYDFRQGDLIRYNQNRDSYVDTHPDANIDINQYPENHQFPFHSSLLTQDSNGHNIVLNNSGQQKFKAKEGTSNSGLAERFKYYDGVDISRYDPEEALKQIEEKNKLLDARNGKGENSSLYDGSNTFDVTFYTPETVLKNEHTENVNGKISDSKNIEFLNEMKQMYQQNYDTIGKVANLSPEILNQMMISQMGIVGQESLFGKHKKYKLKNSLPKGIKNTYRNMKSRDYSLDPKWMTHMYKDPAIKNQYGSYDNFRKAVAKSDLTKTYLSNSKDKSKDNSKDNKNRNKKDKHIYSKGMWQQKELSQSGKDLGLDLKNDAHLPVASLMLQVDNFKKLKNYYPNKSDKELLELSILMHNQPSAALNPIYVDYYQPRNEIDYVNNTKSWSNRYVKPSNPIQHKFGGTVNNNMSNNRKKYATGTAIKNYMQDPNQILQQNRQDIAQAKAQAYTNPWFQGMDMLGGIAMNYGMSNMTKGDVNNLFTQKPDFSKLGFAFGGEIPKQNVPVEIEGKEVGQLPTGEVFEAKGPSHEQGGIDVALPEDTEMYSKRIKVDGVSMADRKKKRHKKSMSLKELLEKSKTDALLKNTIERTNQVHNQEEEFDKGIQEKVTQALNPQPQIPMQGQSMPMQPQINQSQFAFGGNIPGFDWNQLTNIVNGGYIPIMGDGKNFGSSASYHLNGQHPKSQTNTGTILTNPINGDTTQQPSIFSNIWGKASDIWKDNKEGFNTGNMLSNAGTLYGIMASKNNTLNNRANTPPNQNFMKDYGLKGLQTLENQKGYINQVRDETLQDLELSRNSAIRRNRNSARGINTLRGLDTMIDNQINSQQSNIHNTFANNMMNILSQQSQLENNRDQIVMNGEHARDLADRKDNDSYYSERAKNIASATAGMQVLGENMNDIKHANLSEDLVNQLSKYGFEIRNGQLYANGKRATT